MSNPNQQIGKYEIRRRLGSGAFATVWLAHDPTLQADVAIKVLATNWCTDEDVEERFLREARILFQINDPRIVKVFTTGEHDDGCPFFVMDYADRGNLHERIQSRVGANEPFGPLEALSLCREIAEGLLVIHHAGIVHRDLKPSNVLFRTDVAASAGERMMLGDFGIARAMDAEPRNTIIAGSPYYMAPEQADEATAGQVDQRADVYSAAVILHELLTGQVPYPFSTLSEIRRAQLAGERIPLNQLRANLPGTVIWLVDKGMKLDPAARFPTVEAWISALDTAIAGLNDEGAAGLQNNAAAQSTMYQSEQAPATSPTSSSLADPVSDPAATLQRPTTIPPMQPEAASPTPQAHTDVLPAPPSNAAPLEAAEPKRSRRWLRSLILLLLLVLIVAAGLAAAAWYFDWPMTFEW